MRFHIVCLVAWHSYPKAWRVSDDEARYWSCKRCGSKRYTPPTDVPVAFPV